jgi:hypothetical protein
MDEDMPFMKMIGASATLMLYPPAGKNTPPLPLAFQRARLIPIESQVSVLENGVGRGGLNVPEIQYGDQILSV